MVYKEFLWASPKNIRKRYATSPMNEPTNTVHRAWEYLQPKEDLSQYVTIFYFQWNNIYIYIVLRQIKTPVEPISHFPFLKVIHLLYLYLNMPCPLSLIRFSHEYLGLSSAKIIFRTFM